MQYINGSNSIQFVNKTTTDLFSIDNGSGNHWVPDGWNMPYYYLSEFETDYDFDTYYLTYNLKSASKYYFNLSKFDSSKLLLISYGNNSSSYFYIPCTNPHLVSETEIQWDPINFHKSWDRDDLYVFDFTITNFYGFKVDLDTNNNKVYLKFLGDSMKFKKTSSYYRVALVGIGLKDFFFEDSYSGVLLNNTYLKLN